MLQQRPHQEQCAERQSLQGQTTPWGKGSNDGTGKEAEGSLLSQERDFTPERRSAHVVGFHPPPVTTDQPHRAKDKGEAAPDYGLTR